MVNQSKSINQDHQHMLPPSYLRYSPLSLLLLSFQAAFISSALLNLLSDLRRVYSNLTLFFHSADTLPRIPTISMAWQHHDSYAK